MTNSKPVIQFLVLAFGIAWAWIGIATAIGLSMTNPLAQLPAGLAPAVAAFVVRAWLSREGFADATLKPRPLRYWRHYLIAWLTPLALVAATLAVATPLGLWAPDAEHLPGLLTVLGLVLVLPVLTPVYWGEEFGWTGYLRLRLLPGRPVAATFATGLIWAVWHYPLAFTDYIEFDDVAVGLAVWTFSFLCQEVLLTWLRLRSDVWAASLAHAGNNMVLSLLVGEALVGVDTATSTAVTAVPLALLAGWVLLGKRLRPPVQPAPGPASTSTLVGPIG